MFPSAGILLGVMFYISVNEYLCGSVAAVDAWIPYSSDYDVRIGNRPSEIENSILNVIPKANIIGT
jgi:hypothetical protein